MNGGFRNDIGVEAVAEINWVDVVAVGTLVSICCLAVIGAIECIGVQNKTG